MKNCIVCTKEFKPLSGHHKLCSDKCREQHYKRSSEAIRRGLDKKKVHVAEWRRRTKRKAVELMGGCCKQCGYSKCPDALEFHHLDPNGKDFHLAKSGTCRSWESIESELRKCVILCSNCHREVHAGVTTLACSITGNVSHC